MVLEKQEHGAQAQFISAFQHSCVSTRLAGALGRAE